MSEQNERHDAVEDVRRYLKQRLAAGEKVQIVPGFEAAAAEKVSRTPAARLETGAEGDLAAGTAGAEEASVAAAAVDSIERVAAEINACTRCRLHETRTNAVPGVGPADANLVFIGEGPGAEEDARGEPFVGRAGQLLTKIIESVQLQRQEVFISNIVKCRPPNNRDPQPDEIAACEPYLKRQLKLLAPKVICALGRHAAMTLLKTNDSMGRLRTGTHAYEGIRVFPTYHPAALLRNPQWKRPVWEDIQNVRRVYDSPDEKN